jgi:hypothetical protein
VGGCGCERERERERENRLLRRIFGPKGKEVAGGLRILHNAELCNLYASPSIVRVVKSRRVRWLGHVAHMGETPWKA